MKIAVVGANGKAGTLIIKEAVDRGHDVVAIARSTNKTKAQAFLQKDLFDLTSEDLQSFDVVIDAFGTWGDDTLHLHETSLMHLCDCLSHRQTRLLVVGGAGSLYVNEEKTLQLSDSDDFPEMFKPLAQHMAKSLEKLRERTDVRWTYISPAADFQAAGVRNGTYMLGGEHFMLNDAQESYISYADYAVAMIDEAVKGNHIQQRISVVAK